MEIIKKEIMFNGKSLSLETGELAAQTNLAVKASYGDTVILATVVSGDPNPEVDFFPLTVNYQEKLYAGGIIKSSRFVKRDGRPTDAAIITKRMVDHAIRPLFPSDYMDEVQLVLTVLSLDENSDPEFLAMVASSAVLYASDVPWDGPMVSVRVGYIDNKYVINPTRDELEENSDLDMMVSFVGDDKKFLAVEAESNILPEDTIFGAINYARDSVDDVYKLIKEFASEVNPDDKKYEYESQKIGEDVLVAVQEIAKDEVRKIIRMEYDKTELSDKRDDLKEKVLTELEGKYKKSLMIRALEELEKHEIQHLVLDEEHRPDGRGIEEIRNIECKVNLLPRTHGSGLFTRGLTQVLTVVTLGSPSMELLIQDMYGETNKRFLHYYTFPPFSTGETGRVGGFPRSREIGHGMLAERALRPVIPDQKEFPYTILLVSETLSSSGSSSMASACGSTLALMDAGVPIKDKIAGVGVGLITNDDFSKYKIMTDLAYMEDAFGFLDFKMTGTREGVTAIQCDMKVKGIPMDILSQVIDQSKRGRLVVLGKMEKAINAPRDTVSQYAPKMLTTKVAEDQIGKVIGSGGKTIKEIQERTNTEVFIEDDGSVVIASPDIANAQKALDIINGMTRELEIGEVFEGRVKEILDFGALVEIFPGRVGLLHVSEISHSYVEKVEDHVKEGDIVKVKIVGFGENGKISLSMKALESNPNTGDQRHGDQRRDSHGSGSRNIRSDRGRRDPKRRDRRRD
ncbi:polyribonucleotide nucleotidyltransferase [Patescibacteria group bacterium]|nr:polyribonucleotide nucleotidyltransferase [Patescibacteria group bacterium]